MPDLRAKVLALAVQHDGVPYLKLEQDERRALALAVARLALEHAAGVCDDKYLLYDGMEDSASTRYFADKMRGSRDAADQCAAAIRAESKTLGADA